MAVFLFSNWDLLARDLLARGSGTPAGAAAAAGCSRLFGGIHAKEGLQDIQDVFAEEECQGGARQCAHPHITISIELMRLLTVCVCELMNERELDRVVVPAEAQREVEVRGR